MSPQIDESRASYFREKRGELTGNLRDFKPSANLVLTGEVRERRPTVHNQFSGLASDWQAQPQTTVRGVTTCNLVQPQHFLRQDIERLQRYVAGPPSSSSAAWEL